MKKLLTTLVSLCIVLAASAQQDVVSGRIMGSDSLSVPGVAVVMQTLDSTYINAEVSDADGYFRIRSSVRPYRLVFQHLAYKVLMLESSEDNVGTVYLEDAVNELAGVTVRATRPIVKINDGRLDYDLRAISENKLIDNAFDLIKEIPSISSTDNSLSITGSMGGTTILLNGVKSNMSMEQMQAYLRTLPADRVEKVEVVYNPPATWHITGSAINVILRKENRYTLQGQLRGAYKNYTGNGGEAGGSLFLSSPKVSLDLIYNFDDERKRYEGYERNLHTVGTEVYDIDFNINQPMRRQAHNLYTSLRYNFTEKDILDLSYVGQYAPKSDEDYENTSNYFSDSYSQQRMKDFLHDISLTYTSSFGLKTGVEYTRFKNYGIQSLDLVRPTGLTEASDYDMSQRVDRANVFADMAHDWNGWKLSYGVKYAYSKSKNAQYYTDIENAGAGNYSNASETTEHTTDVSIGLSKSFLDNKLNASLYLIEEFYKINDYKKNAFIPRASLSYQFDANNYASLMYQSVRVYPSYWERQEYTTYTDEYNMQIGNPTLMPSRYSFYTFLYMFKNKYMFSFQYQDMDDFFVSQNYQSQTELRNILQTVNVDHYSNLIFDFVVPFNIGDRISVNSALGVSRERYKDSDFFDLAYDRKKWQCYVNVRPTVTLVKKPMITFNMMVHYKSPFLQGIYDIDKNWGIAAGLKWEIIKDKAILNIQANDIFNTSSMPISVNYGTQNYYSKYDNWYRNVMVTFTYNFKGYKEKSAKYIDTSRFGL